MEWHDVASSAISRVGYDPKSMTLAVEWRSAGLYYYFDVSEATFIELRNAPSVGHFVSTVIKPAYRYSKA
jgi:hypothetical protein